MKKIFFILFTLLLSVNTFAFGVGVVPDKLNVSISDELKIINPNKYSITYEISPNPSMCAPSEGILKADSTTKITCNNTHQKESKLITINFKENNNSKIGLNPAVAIKIVGQKEMHNLDEIESQIEANKIASKSSSKKSMINNYFSKSEAKKIANHPDFKINSTLILLILVIFILLIIKLRDASLYNQMVGDTAANCSKPKPSDFNNQEKQHTQKRIKKATKNKNLEEMVLKKMNFDKT